MQMDQVDTTVHVIVFTVVFLPCLPHQCNIRAKEHRYRQQIQYQSSINQNHQLAGHEPLLPRLIFSTGVGLFLPESSHLSLGSKQQRCVPKTNFDWTMHWKAALLQIASAMILCTSDPKLNVTLEMLSVFPHSLEWGNEQITIHF